MQMRDIVPGNPRDIMLSHLRDHPVTTVLDIGCGSGGLVAFLRATGFLADGLDPQNDALETARAQVPQAQFFCAGGEAAPCADHCYDAVIFQNSLHHVPDRLMDAALLEARRIIKPGGIILIQEPLAEGSFFEAMRVVEDETEVRQAALAALARIEARGLLVRQHMQVIARIETFADVDAFAEKLLAADPARRARLISERVALEAAFLACGAPTEDGQRALTQPILDVVLQAGDEPMS